MPPVALIIAGFVLLAVFAFGGKVQGRGEPAYIASAARAFVGPWLLLTLLNLWVRWWGGQPLGTESLWHLFGALLPVVAAFAVWRKFARTGDGRP